jgi:hypothetical protein
VNAVALRNSKHCGIAARISNDSLEVGPCERLWRALVESGAPRPMNMGTIVLPWRNDAVAGHALQSAKLRRNALPYYTDVTLRPVWVHGTF